MVIGGTASGQAGLARVTAGGARDRTFSADGATGVAIDTSGRIVVGGILGGDTVGEGDQWVGRILAQ